MTRRASGILLHPTSLPGPFGIGDLGPSSRHFLDWLQAAGQTTWQMLPLVPPGSSHSPYDGSSAFAGNPLLISPQDLEEDGLLTASDLADVPPFDTASVRYEMAGKWKSRLLRIGWNRFRQSTSHQHREPFEDWSTRPEQNPWLEDWAMFASLKAHFNGKPWSEWTPDLRDRETAAMAAVRQELEDEIGYHRFVQYLFAVQWSRLRETARQSSVRLLGDMPFYVALDSADVWAHRHLFKVDGEGQPIFVAGVPPDYFSETGQRWGNPVFRWDSHEADGYRWWIERVGYSLAIYDSIRIDHFRAFASYWEIDASEPTAVNGHWTPGPGLQLFERLREVLGELPLVAEDLGHITSDVRELKRSLELPGMRVLQFGFDSSDSEHLPHNFTRNTVAYTGTHDNDTTVGWLEGLEPEKRQRVLDYVSGDGSRAHWDLIRSVSNSVATLSIFPMQDVLGLGSRHRMNTPSSGEGNWAWRLQPEMADDATAAQLRRITVRAGRLDTESMGPPA
jgi:4-alpha-glucanotransferase